MPSSSVFNKIFRAAHAKFSKMTVEILRSHEEPVDIDTHTPKKPSRFQRFCCCLKSNSLNDVNRPNRNRISSAASLLYVRHFRGEVASRRRAKVSRCCPIGCRWDWIPDGCRKHRSTTTRPCGRWIRRRTSLRNDCCRHVDLTVGCSCRDRPGRTGSMLGCWEECEEVRRCRSHSELMCGKEKNMRIIN
jgi:hypothetical protein